MGRHPAVGHPRSGIERLTYNASEEATSCWTTAAERMVAVCNVMAWTTSLSNLERDADGLAECCTMGLGSLADCSTMGVGGDWGDEPCRRLVSEDLDNGAPEFCAVVSSKIID